MVYIVCDKIIIKKSFVFLFREFMYIYIGNLIINWNYLIGKVIKFVWEKKFVEFNLFKKMKNFVSLIIKY